MSYLGIEGYHAFITGARGGIGSAIVKELRDAGCKVTAHDIKPARDTTTEADIFHVQGDISDETSIASSIQQAVEHFGPINILSANAGIIDESEHRNVWDLPLEIWEKVYRVNVRGTFLTIKHFLRSAKASQETTGQELENLSIVVTGSECGKFGLAGHAEYASGKAGLQYGLVPTVKNEMVKVNARGRINAVAPGGVNTEMIGDLLDLPKEMYLEGQATVALKKIGQPEDVAKTVAFLASHRASGHMSGQCLSVDGGMEGRVIWREEEIFGNKPAEGEQPSVGLPRQISPKRTKKKLKVAYSFDFDAISGWLGTGQHPNNSIADYSAGYLSAHLGVPRLLKVLRRLGIADKVTWCIPGHTIETFPEETKAIVQTGAEIAVHGYAHEGASQMTAEQERDVLAKCIQLIEDLTGKKPRGYRAPLLDIKERTIALLQEHDFLWDSSITHYDNTPYFLPKNPEPVKSLNFDPNVKAETWMHPSNNFSSLPKSDLVEIPMCWYADDMTPMQYFPNVPNSHGYVDARVVERMWKDRFLWLKRELEEDGDDGGMKVFSIVNHPDTSGMAHVIGHVEQFLMWIKSFGDEVEFVTCADIAEEFRQSQKTHSQT